MKGLSGLPRRDLPVNPEIGGCPVGGGAPLGSGVEIMLAVALVYGSKKIWFLSRQDKLQNFE
jgi:hypothetical protein